MGDPTEDQLTDEELAKDVAAWRQWRDENRDGRVRHKTMSADLASAWEGVNTLLMQLDRTRAKLDDADLSDEQIEVYEAGYIAGQKMCAQRVRQLAREFDA